MQRKWKRRWLRLAKAVVPPVAAGLLMMSAYSPVWANAVLPTGGQIVAGSGAISTSGSTMTVNQTTSSLVANWQSFSIGAGGTVNFVQPSASAVALNRVVGNNASSIYGTLTANGRVYLINPNGILFAPGSQVNVGGLVASTLDISNDNFMNGKYTFEKNGTAGSVINQGTVTAGDHAVFIGPQVRNEGVVAARVTGLAAGDKVSLDFTGDKLLNVTVDTAAAGAGAVNTGTITADGGLVVMSTGTKAALLNTVVNNSGVIRAQTVNNVDGVIRLEGSTVNVAGTLDASAPNGGNGGFIETSGAKVVIADGTTVTTAAPGGKAGTWLIDPTDFTIAAGSGALTTSGIGASTLQTALGSGNVILATAEAGTGNGDITISAPVSWSANTLTLTAHRNINILSTLTASGTAALAMNYGSSGSGSISYGLTGSGFTGRIDFPGRSGNGFLTINGTSYTVITSLGAAGSTTGLDLQGMAGNLSGSYFLGGDIDASATQYWNWDGSIYNGFLPVGTFSGTFDGGGHTISGLTINRPSTAFVGLFSSTWEAKLRNVGLVGGSVTGSGRVGGLVGYAFGIAGSITDSYNTGSVASGANSDVGGLAGYSQNAITGSYATGSVTGISGVGGLVGTNGGIITDSYATGTVSGSDILGGLVGYNDYEGTITGSYANGSVTGTERIGGLAGQNGGAIANSYAAGTVSGSGSNIGGLVGMNVNTSSPATIGSITGSYATGNVYASGGRFIGGLVGYNDGAITGSYATGNVYASGGESVGGLVGDDGGSITNSYASGSVSGGSGVGGLVGNKWLGTITNSYATGSVSGSSGVGGLVGTVEYYEYSPEINPTITSSYWDTQTSGQTGSAAGTGLTTAQMKQKASYAWGFDANGISADSVWRIYDGYYYPLLRSFLTPITVTANNATKTYDGTTASSGAGVTYSATPDWSLLLGTVAYDTNGVKNVGTCAITPTGLYSTSQNGYDITYVAGTLTINKAVLTSGTLTGTVSKTYDGTTTAALSGVGLSSVFSGDEVTVTATSAAYDDKNAGSGKTVTASGLSLSGADAGNYTLSITTAAGNIGVITPKTLTGDLTGTVSKTYDGTNTATLTDANFGSLSGVIAGDNVSMISSTTATYDDKNAGSGKLVSATGLSLSGADAGNYTLSAGSVSGNIGIITPKALTSGTLTGTVSKTYDGTTTAALSGVGLSSVFSGDDVTVAATSAAYDDKNAGSGKTVTASGLSLSGADAGNYTLSITTAAGNIGVITPKALTATLTGTVSKTYDGTNTATLTADNFGSLTGVIAGDNVSAVSATSAVYDDKNAGSGKTVTASGLSLSGADAGNYTLSTASGAIGTITPKELTAYLPETGITKTYDGNTNVWVFYASLQGVVSGDEVEATNDYPSVFDNKNVGTGKLVTMTDIYLDGAAAGNYTLANTTASAYVGTITPKALTATLTGTVSKTYDGTTAATLTAANFGSLTGVVSGDTVTLNTSTTGTYADKNAGSGKTVTATGVSLSGADAGNYTLTANAVSGKVGTITSKNLDGSTLTGTVTKTYDGDNVAMPDELGLSGFIAGDSVYLFASDIVYDNKNVGSGKTVTATGVTIAGDDAGNYTISMTSAAGNIGVITPKALTAALTGTVTKTYDGTTAATLTAGNYGSLTGVVSGDTVTLNISTTGTYADKNAGSDKTVTATGVSLSGADAGNYTLDPVSGAVGTIEQASLTASLAGAVTKTYDGTNSATLAAGNYNLGGTVYGSDAVTLSYATDGTYDNKNAGTGKTVSVSGLALAGADAGNYTLTSTTASGAVGVIDKAPLTASLTGAVTKTYDGTNSATLAAGNYNLGGTVYGSDAVTLSYATDGTYDNKNAGTGKTVSVSGLALAGADAGNYTLTSTTASGAVGVINKAALTITAASNTKTYDGNTGAAAVPTVTSGLVAGDSVTGLVQEYTDKNAGSGKTLQVTGYTVNDGNGGNNYTVTTVSNNTGVIDKAALTVTATGVNKVYDGTTAAAVIYGDNRIAGDVLTVSGTATYDDKNAGSGKTVSVTGITLGGADAGNYTCNTSAAGVTADITARALTVTAGNASKIYGTANPTFSATYAGFASGEDSSVLSGTLSFTTLATTASPPGRYAITPSGLTGGGNYSISYVNGTLTVGRPVAYEGITAYTGAALRGGVPPVQRSEAPWITIIPPGLNIEGLRFFGQAD